MLRHAFLFVWLTPVSETAMPIAYFETEIGCIAALAMVEAEYKRQGFGNAEAVCALFNFNPETSPRPLPRPERRS